MMAEFQKNSPAWERRKKQICRRLDIATLLLGAIIIFTAMATVNADYDLSKSNPQGCVFLMDEPNVIMKKFKRAVTDSDTCVKYAEGKDGINNLMTIYSVFTGKTLDEIEREFEGKGYGDFKMAVGEVCADALAPVQEKFKCYMSDKAQLEAQMKKGAEEASYVARRTLSKVQKKLGFVQVR